MKLTAFFCVLLTLSANLVGQNRYLTPNIFPKSPNAAAIEKFGDYPVNMFSGVPNISIPLYEIQVGDIRVPITLQYHASGITVDEVASWAGLGWSVATGGQISRKIIGKADEGPGGYFQGNLRQTSNINTQTYADLQYLENVRSGLLDTEPDIYSYDFPGRQGKFFLDGRDTNFSVRLIPFSPIKIIRPSAKQINYFRILDENGNDYFFNTTEFSNFYPNNSSEYYVSSWMLNRIISQNKRDTVNFSYNSNSVDLPNTTTESQTVSYNSMNYYSEPKMFSDNPGGVALNTNYTTINEQKLSTIYYKNGKVIFELADGNREDLSKTKALKNIIVYALDYSTNQYKLLKSIHFYQSYFIKNAQADTKRLRLDSIGIFDSNNSQIQRYSFGYENSILLPANSSNGKDFWGYYNGNDFQGSLIPSTKVPFQGGTLMIGDGNRDPNSSTNQAYILKRINYPTGGYTDFQYETNSYLSYETDGYTIGYKNKLAGGLRVSVIKNYDGLHDDPVIKIYKYENARLNSFLSNRFFSVTQKVRGYAIAGNSFMHVGEQSQTTYMSAPNSELYALDGIPVVYGKVTEYVSTGLKNLGKTIYVFSDCNDTYATSSISGKTPISSYFFLRGQLLEKSTYKANDDRTYSILEKEQMSYSAFPLTRYEGVGLEVEKNVINTSSGNPDFLIDPGASITPNDESSYQYSNIAIPSDDNYLTSKVSTIYNPNDSAKFVLNKEVYKYGNIIHQQWTQKISRNSLGDTIVTVRKFPPDYISQNSYTGNNILDSMVAKNINAQVIETRDSVKSQNLALTGTISAQLNLFKMGINNAVMPDRIKKMDIAKSVKDFSPSSILSGNIVSDPRYSQLISFDKYDNVNNLTQYTARNAGPTSIFWDYGASFPVAEIKDANKDNTAYTSFEADSKGNWNFSGIPVRNDNAPAGFKAYDLSQGTITSPTLDVNRSYIVSYWSIAGNATVASSSGLVLAGSAKGWNLYQHTISPGVSSLTVSGNLIIDELKVYPANTQVVSYTYNPMVGVSTVTDEKNLVARYNYDNALRLSNIKDAEDKIDKRFDYNYSQTNNIAKPIKNYYFNSEITIQIKKNDCDSNHSGSYVSYTVPEQKYVSNISQSDADNKAQYDISTLGQSYANSMGVCLQLYFSDSISGNFTKANCGYGYSGATKRVTLPARSFNSLISKRVADSLAQAYFPQYGQNIANAMTSQNGCPYGTDIAKWRLTYTLDNTTPDLVYFTITRPVEDINNSNTVYFLVSTYYDGDFLMHVDFPSGSTSYSFSRGFSSQAAGNFISSNLNYID